VSHSSRVATAGSSAAMDVMCWILSVERDGGGRMRTQRLAAVVSRSEYQTDRYVSAREILVKRKI
jgi:hypothetical protein